MSLFLTALLTLTQQSSSASAACRLGGNKNVNQNPLPLTLTTLLLREHNRRALTLAQENPDWGDEEIFQGARK
jgi:peroxidase